ncbi:hypothetical protein PJ311_03730 [Bacillus sp. CLL-7-23]|uniref:Uncharacterized protein n=1 Tax=Bacillus changyiensis TaxID=3004103 RepID=A0ABT4X0B6_9BACI|nr:hypothetical protein [Bacillus changyiensis]MDA1475402.1 hypothetical protein [Bacillus changyiensis]MDA7025723.1 hypothetical protein [Bacillus changyiensis]
MEEDELKTVLQKTFEEVYRDLDQLVKIAKKGRPSLEKNIDEMGQRLKQNILAVEFQLKTK